MTTRTLTTILAALLALAIVAPASATANHEITSYANPATGQAWIAGKLPMDTPREARSAVARTGANDIARDLDMTVLASDVNHDLASLGIGPMAMYAGTKGGDDAVVLMTSYGADLWMFLFVMPDIAAMDADAVVTWVVESILSGEVNSPGLGFVSLGDDGLLGTTGKDA